MPHPIPEEEPVSQSSHVQKLENKTDITFAQLSQYLKQLNILPSTGQENNAVQPKQRSGLALRQTCHRFSPFNCWFKLKPVLNWANVSLSNTSDRSMNYDSFLNWTFSSPNMVRTLYFVLNWLVMRCKLWPELEAEAQQTSWSKM